MARKKGKGLYLATFLLFIAGAGYLVYAGVAGNSVYHLEVSEALTLPADKPARLFGTVGAEGIERLPGKPGVAFRLQDQNNAQQTLGVVFEGAVPDTFQAGAEVIVEGRLDSSRTSFRARTLMTKCPSKYQKENRS